MTIKDDSYLSEIKAFAKENNLSTDELLEFGPDFYEKLDKLLKMMLKSIANKNDKID